MNAQVFDEFVLTPLEQSFLDTYKNEIATGEIELKHENGRLVVIHHPEKRVV
jgi:hypothetical protein